MSSSKPGDVKSLPRRAYTTDDLDNFRPINKLDLKKIKDHVKETKNSIKLTQQRFDFFTKKEKQKKQPTSGKSVPEGLDLAKADPSKLLSKKTRLADINRIPIKIIVGGEEKNYFIKLNPPSKKKPSQEEIKQLTETFKKLIDAGIKPPAKIFKGDGSSKEAKEAEAAYLAANAQGNVYFLAKLKSERSDFFGDDKEGGKALIQLFDLSDKLASVQIDPSKKDSDTKTDKDKKTDTKIETTPKATKNREEVEGYLKLVDGEIIETSQYIKNFYGNKIKVTNKDGKKVEGGGFCQLNALAMGYEFVQSSAKRNATDGAVAALNKNENQDATTNVLNIIDKGRTGSLDSKTSTQFKDLSGYYRASTDRDASEGSWESVNGEKFIDGLKKDGRYTHRLATFAVDPKSGNSFVQFYPEYGAPDTNLGTTQKSDDRTNVDLPIIAIANLGDNHYSYVQADAKKLKSLMIASSYAEDITTSHRQQKILENLNLDKDSSKPSLAEALGDAKFVNNYLDRVQKQTGVETAQIFGSELLKRIKQECPPGQETVLVEKVCVAFEAQTGWADKFKSALRGNSPQKKTK